MGPSVFRSLWAGSAKLPPSVAYFAGEIRNNPIDWNDGGVLVVVWNPSVASTTITTDTQISGGLWATDTGLEFRDGMNTAALPATWAAGDRLIVALRTETDGVRNFMRLVRID